MRVSIVIPNYNYEKYIEQTILSVLSQTHYPDEIIIIDDASTDRSVDIISRYENEKNVRVIYHKTNKGVLDHIEFGLSNATGDFVLFLSSDDYIEKTMLEEYLLLLEKKPAAGFAYGLAYKQVEPEGKRTLIRPKIDLHEGYISPQEAKKLLYKWDYTFCGVCVLVNRKLALSEGGYDKNLLSYCDGFMHMKLAMMHGFCFVNKPLATYRSHGSSYSQAIIRKEDALKKITREVLRQMKEKPHCFDEAFIKRWLQRWNFKMALFRVLSSQGYKRKLLFGLSFFYALLYTYFDILNYRISDFKSYMLRIRETSEN